LEVIRYKLTTIFIKLAKRSCYWGDTYDYLEKALESENSWEEYKNENFKNDSHTKKS